MFINFFKSFLILGTRFVWQLLILFTSCNVYAIHIAPIIAMLTCIIALALLFAFGFPWNATPKGYRVLIPLRNQFLLPSSTSHLVIILLSRLSQEKIWRQIKNQTEFNLWKYISCVHGCGISFILWVGNSRRDNPMARRMTAKGKET